MSRLSEGEIAPDFQLDSTVGPIRLYELLDEADQGVVVYFYPKASTPGCTTQACDFRDSLSSLKSCGYTVIGISADKLTSLEKFRDKQGLNFPLATDQSKNMLTEWGAYGEKKNYGRVFRGVIRSTVVVNKDKTVKLAMYNVRAKGHVERLRRKLGC
ncbi:MAG: peroxiredoxin [Actinomycetaceae bacterium]|nr:peroxiredoxin [Actinomycetaceae bacterium]